MNPERETCFHCGAPVTVTPCNEGGDCAFMSHTHPHYDAGASFRVALAARLDALTDEQVVSLQVHHKLPSEPLSTVEWKTFATYIARDCKAWRTAVLALLTGTGEAQ